MRSVKLFLVLGLLAAGPGYAAPGLVILPFAKDRGGAIHRQVKEALCAQLTCAKSKRPSKKQPVLVGKVDAKHHRVLFVLKAPSGNVNATGTLVRGRLTPDSVSGLVQQIGEALQPTPTRPPEEPTPTPAIPSEPATPAPTPTPPPSRAPAASEPSATPAPAAEPSAPAASVTAEKKEETVSVTGAPAPRVIVDLGADGLNRNFAYSGLTSGTLYGYQAPLIISPRFHAELYPLAFFTDGFLQGLGVWGDYAFAVALKSQLGSTSYSTSFSRLELGLKLRLSPVAASRFLIAIEAGYSIHNFAIGAAADGTTITGEPPLSYNAVKLGIELGVPLGDVITVFLKPEGRYVLSSHQLIGDAYFAKGSGFGLGGELGVRFQIVSHLELEVAGEVIRYSLTFNTSPSDAYVAQGSTDMYLGGHAAVRFTF